MPAIILSDNGATSGSAGLKTSGGNDGVLQLQTTTSGGTPTTAISISNTQVVTYTNQPTYTGGTANGVLYLNGSKAVTSGTALVFDGSQLDIPAGSAAAPSLSTPADPNTGIFFPAADTIAFAEGGVEAMRLDSSGNMGLGVTPSASTAKTFEIGGIGNTITGFSTSIYFSENAYYNAGFKYGQTGVAAQYAMDSGQHRWYNAPSGTAGNAISFTQAMTLDASGNFMVGGTSANGRARFVAAASTDCVMNLETSTNNYASAIVLNALNDNGAIYNYIRSTSPTTEHWKIGGPGASSTLAFSTGGTERMRIDSGGSVTFGTYGYIKNFNSGYLGVGNGNTALMFLDESSSTRRVIPRQNNNGGSDGNIDLGDGGSRFRTLYATTGTINTSDAREKTPVTPLTADELTAASQIAASVGTYQWLQAVEEKGAAARHHAGLTVQRAIEIMEANNLNPFDYGFICYDAWPQESNKAAGDRYSFRMDQLSLFIARGQQAIIEQMQTRLAALEAK